MKRCTTGWQTHGSHGVTLNCQPGGIGSRQLQAQLSCTKVLHTIANELVCPACLSFARLSTRVHSRLFSAASMQASSADNAIAELSAKAVDLVLRHNVHPEKISQAISRGLREEAESLPRLEVLYNDTYGGFEYSEEFDKFLTATMQQWSSDQMLKTPPHMSPYMTAGQDDTRINDCACIRPFGKQQAEKFPVAFRPVSLYHALELDKYQDAMATIRYSSDAVEVQKATKACDHLPKGLLMAYHAQTSQRRPAGNRTRDIDDLQFCEAIAKHGENSEKIWRAQKHLCRDVMLSLRAWKGNGSLGHQEGHLAAAWKTFGLMCASGSYCQLSIAEVPQIVDWGVHEYDGKERVYVK